jgi:hypothetical protein
MTALIGVLYDAVVTQAPAANDAPLVARISPYMETGPCPWPTRQDVALPLVGDRVLVARSDEGAWWCLAWWPHPLEEA